MKRTKVLRFIAIISILISISCESNSQTFEGTIVYRTTTERPENSEIPIEEFKLIFKEMDTITNLYLKNQNYKFVTLDDKTNEPTIVMQYDSESNTRYRYAAVNDFCIKTKVNIDSLTKPKITTNIDDTITIMGHRCHSMTIENEGISKATVYFSEDYKVDTEPYKNCHFGFLDFIYRTGALPLKMIIDGGGIANFVYTAIEVKEERLENNFFKVPYCE